MNANTPTNQKISEGFRKVIEGFREKRVKEALKKARSFKEFLQYKVNYLAIDVCSKYAVTGSHLLDYQAFAKMIIADWYRAYVEYSINPELVNIDDILEYYEKTWAIPRRLDPEIIKQLEIELINLMQNIDKIKEEYENLRRSGGTYD
jgi:hypothetical protein